MGCSLEEPQNSRDEEQAKAGVEANDMYMTKQKIDCLVNGTRLHSGMNVVVPYVSLE